MNRVAVESEIVRSQVETRKPPLALTALLDGAIDYAGLFPPAALSLEISAQNYSAYRSGTNSGMLGRFLLPASRLTELAGLLAGTVESTPPWRISALVGNDLEFDMEQIAKFNQNANQHGSVDTIELAPRYGDRIEELAPKLPRAATVYFELSLDAPGDQFHALARTRARAKIRTGGIKPEAIPTPLDLATFVLNCANAGVPFKATAGLHHPLRGSWPLTYEPNAPRAEMHGFLNLLLASAFAMNGAPVAQLSEILSETEASSFLFTDAEARWKTKSIPVSALRNARRRSFISFGSCSFEEPVQYLTSLGWL